MEGKKVPLYGDGLNIRDWLYVEDHCDAIWTVLNRGRFGEAITWYERAHELSGRRRAQITKLLPQEDRPRCPRDR